MFKYFVYYEYKENTIFPARGSGNALVTLNHPFGTSLDNQNSTDIDEVVSQIKKENDHDDSDDIVVSNIILLPIV